MKSLLKGFTAGFLGGALITWSVIKMKRAFFYVRNLMDDGLTDYDHLYHLLTVKDNMPGFMADFVLKEAFSEYEEEKEKMMAETAPYKA